MRCSECRLSVMSRRYAEECRKLAAKATRPEEKDALKELARAWDRVAKEQEPEPLEELDRRTRRALRRHGASRP
jgi:hypothetical protein